PRFSWVIRLPLPLQCRQLMALALVHVIPESLAVRDLLQDLVRRPMGVDVVVGHCVGIEQLGRTHGFAQVLVRPCPYPAAVWRQRPYRVAWNLCRAMTERLVLRPALEQRGVGWWPSPPRWHLLGLWSPLFLASGSAGRVCWETIGFPPPIVRMEPALPAHLETFLRAGPPPVLFTFGSHMKSIGVDRVIRLAREVTDRLGCRAVVAMLDNEVPAAEGELPDSLFVTPFVSLDALL